MVIDELIVILGLDARKFTEGQRDALAAFKKTREGAQEFGRDVEQQGMRISEVFGIARKGAIGLLGAFVGGEAAAFLSHVITMDAATGRMSRTIGTSVANLSTWQYMIRQVGGEAASATGALSALQQEIETVRQGGGMFEGGFASLMNQAGVSIRDDADVALRKIQSFISGQISAGKMRPEEAATFLRRVPGMNQDMLNLLLGDFKRIEESAKKVGTATDETARAAELLQSRFSLIIQAMERFGASLIPILDILTKPMKDITLGDVNKAFPDDPSKPLFEPGSLADRFWRWQYRLIQGAEPGGAGAPGGGTRGDRNNNPGNLKYGAFARAHGATGADAGGFAVFPTREAGSAAQVALVQGSSYQGLTLDEFARRYAEGSPSWERSVGGSLGIGPGDVVNNRDPRLIDAIRRAEGTGARGAAAGRGGGRVSTSTSTSEVNIGKVEVNAPNATDADGIAVEIGAALKRQSLIAPANYGLA